MQRYAVFAFDDHRAYLRQMEGLLRALTAQGVHTTVALFDPAEYEEFCADTRHDPDTSRAAPAIRRRWQPRAPPLPTPASPSTSWSPAHRRGGAAGHLGVRTPAASRPVPGDCAGGDDIARASFDRASAALPRRVEAAGAGLHHLVAASRRAAPRSSPCSRRRAGSGLPELAEPGALVFCTVLAGGIARHSPGGVVLRTTVPGITGHGPRLDAARRLAATAHRGGGVQRLLHGRRDRRTRPAGARRRYRAGSRLPPPRTNDTAGARPARHHGGTAPSSSLASRTPPAHSPDSTACAARRASSAVSVARAAAAARSHCASVCLASVART